MDPTLVARLAGFGLKALPFVLAFGVGFGAAESYEHKAPWGLTHQRDRAVASIPGKEAVARAAGIAAQVAADKPAFAQWSATLAACRSTSAQAVADADAFTSNQARAAYRLGLKSCGVAHASADPVAATDPASDPSGVREPSDDFAFLYRGGAFTPAVVPGSGPSPPHR